MNLIEIKRFSSGDYGVTIPSRDTIFVCGSLFMVAYTVVTELWRSHAKPR
jgi:hypothetical protein